MSTREVATTQQRNEEIVRRLFDAFTANDAGAMDELLAPDFTAHGLPPALGAGAAANMSELFGAGRLQAHTSAVPA